jgi:hypothetical protein
MPPDPPGGFAPLMAQPQRVVNLSASRRIKHLKARMIDLDLFVGWLPRAAAISDQSMRARWTTNAAKPGDDCTKLRYFRPLRHFGRRSDATVANVA